MLAHRGINRTFQSPKPFLSLTVRENVRGRRDLWPYRGAHRSTCRGCSPRWSSTTLADRPAGDLNSAQQKMLDLARALATGPRLLLVDELAAGLNPAELDAHGRRGCARWRRTAWRCWWSST